MSIEPTTPTPPSVTVPAEALELLQSRLSTGRRFLLGMVGAPGSGKSTLARALCDHAGSAAQLVPMDGYHLANVQLQRLGRAQRKGAPDTFDSHGYVSLLRRLREPVDGVTVYAPDFRREIEEPIANAIAVEPQVPLIVTEGNYLLLDEPGWRDVRGLLDEVWYVEEDEALRLKRLVARHEQFGRAAEDARRWVAQTDEPNARRIEATRSRAHRVFRWGTGFVR
ncbi:nucleoside/nucleotide kinase family protein [Hydrogenophaga sp. RWCD_12]|uniref:nucleoside/nucleotide kinase family protein n=1 Tax=Hydrogenophaga sp. RWCD_12 TaxID=3391190 RepID=UPI00398478A1